MPTVLCIDDDRHVLELEKAIFESNGYTVLVAAGGLTGIAMASAGGVDVVVLDYKMPDMDGGEVAERLWREHPGLPVVICSGYFDTIPEWLKWFAAACVQKGDGPQALLTAVHDVVRAKPSKPNAA